MSLIVKTRRWLLKLLIALKQIKQVAMTADELNEMLAANLPEEFALDVPGCQGMLIIEAAELSLPQNQNRFCVELFCAMDISTLGTPIYRAHLVITLAGMPLYDPDHSRIRMHLPEVADVQLVKDQYSLLHDTKNLIEQFAPLPITSLVTSTFRTTMNILSAGACQDVANYLNIYLSGSMQKIFDFHRPEVEQIVKDLADSGDLEYEMDPDILEEEIFAELGKDVRVENGALQFVFHDD